MSSARPSLIAETRHRPNTVPIVQHVPLTLCFPAAYVFRCSNVFCDYGHHVNEAVSKHCFVLTTANTQCRHGQAKQHLSDLDLDCTAQCRLVIRNDSVEHQPFPADQGPTSGRSPVLAPEDLQLWKTRQIVVDLKLRLEVLSWLIRADTSITSSCARNPCAPLQHVPRQNACGNFPSALFSRSRPKAKVPKGDSLAPGCFPNSSMTHFLFLEQVYVTKFLAERPTSQPDSAVTNLSGLSRHCPRLVLAPLPVPCVCWMG